MSQDTSRQAGSFLIKAAAFTIVMAGLRAAQPLVVPFLVSVFLAVICLPTLQWLQEKGVPTALALLLIIAMVGSIGMGLVLVVGTSVTDFREQLPAYQDGIVQQAKDAMVWLQEKGLFFSEDDKVRPDNVGPELIVAYVGRMLLSLGSVLGNAFVIFLTFVFILLEAAGLPSKLRAIAGGSDAVNQRVEAIQADIRHYISLKTIFSLLTGGVITIWLWILGVDYALLWGLLAFLLNYVPNVGSFIAAIPAVGLALIQLGPGAALYAALGFVVVNVVIGSVIEPRLMGRGLGLSTLVVFLSLIFWGWILGPMGMILSVPLTMIAKIILERNPDTHWIAILMSSEESVGKE